MRHFLGIVLSCVWITVAMAQLAPSDRAAVQAYRSAIAAVASRPPGRGIEAALKAFHVMQAALMQLRNGDTVLESLSDEEFARLEKVEGVFANREEVVFVRPNVDYFSGLARARGDGADRAFFAALKATYPDSVWPEYVAQQTDATGCTRFGSLSVVGAYVRWAGFIQQHPTRYRDDAKKEVEAAFEALVESTCACDDLTTVERELTDFLRRVETPTPRAAVEKRLQALREGRSGVRARCIGG